MLWFDKKSIFLNINIFLFLYYSSGYALPSISQNTSGQYNNQYPNGYRGSSSYPSLVNGSKNYNQPPAGKEKYMP